MSTLLTNHLKKCSEIDEIFQPLYSQWIFDEQLAAKALQNVGAWFPHYSRHDASHARQILIHIERLLGDENITKLSATDTWLILEASYFHDIGMLVPFDHAVKDFNSTEFHRHLENARSRSRGDEKCMIDALIAIPKEKWASCFLDIGFSPLYAIQLLREIIADYYRAKHPDRSALIISDPKELGINSPRTELIPARLFGLLGKICSHHGKSFEDVMLLPYRQVGMGRDDCHPRFVACLLRLGDLLDLDDNRFCPVMLHMAGVIPESSKAHIDKHASIRHFRADRERIEIEAECESYDGYVATNQWFTWLREEIQRQMGRWFDIVPARSFGLLPSVGDLKVRLKDWKIYGENERPHFKIDAERAFELLQGAGLYERKEQAMRELLQNAVDATLIRAWIEHGEYRRKPSEPIRHSDQPRSEHVLKILHNYNINIEIKKSKEDGDYNYWRIDIQDQGAGISEEDLLYMARIGGSKSNKKRRDLIESMPIWMRPSGIYGIGLQSVFLLTNEVQIETRNIDTGQALSIKLTNPEGAEKGNIYVRYGEKWDINTFGTLISFIYKSNKKSFSVPSGSHYVMNALKNSDMLLGDYDDINILKICDEIENFFEISQINGHLDLAEFSIDRLFDQIIDNQYWYYVPEENLELTNVQIGSSGFFNIFYRGQYIDDRTWGFYFISVTVNLLDEYADQVLSLNRNKIRKEIEEKLRQRVHRALQEFFKSDAGRDCFEKLHTSQKSLLAAEYELQGWGKLNFGGVDWSQVIISVVEAEKSIKVPINKLADYESILYVQDNSRSTPQILPDNEQQIILFSKPYYNEKLYPLISKFLRGKLYISYREQSMERKVVVFDKNEKPPISVEQLQTYCDKLCGNQREVGFSWLFRETIPCLSEYGKLTLSGERYFTRAFELDKISPRMLFPLRNMNNRITVGDFEKLCEWVFKNKADPSTTLESIRDTYKEFIAWIDEDVMKDDVKWKEMRGSEFGRKS